MKKTLLVTAILSGLVSATAGAATVYDKEGTTLKIGGRAEVRGEFIDTDDATVQDKSRARINFKGQTQISENLIGFAKMEYQIEPSTKDGSDLDNRYLFVGLGTQVGNFSYGKQDTANVLVSDMTDIASVHSGIQQIIGKDKTANTFLYDATFIEALTLQANYTADSIDSDSNQFGVSALYGFDFGLDLAASYTSEDEANQATLGAAYSINDLYLGLTYAMGDADATDDYTSLEFAAQYKFTKEFRLIGVIGMQEEADVDEEDFYALEAQYRFNKSIRTYISYALNNLDDGDDSLVAGLRYNF